MLRNPALMSGLYFALFSASILHASTPAPDGYHDVPIGSNGKQTVVRVKDSIGPRLHGQQPASDGKYDPQNMDLGRTSSFSNKSFSTGSAALSKNDAAYEAQTDHTFITKSYSGTKPDSTADFSQKYKTTAYAASARTSDDFQKTFATSSSDLPRTHDNDFASKTSSYQGKTAVLDNEKKVPYSGFSTLGDKTFFDPAMTHVKRDPYATSLDVSRMTDLPNRPLTIDEVRSLINHETIPDLNSKPEPPSKPLNDPNYEPPTVAPFANEPVKPGPEEKDSGLPSPGTMASPQTSEPLPK